jgi:PBSX family phage portal protein
MSKETKISKGSVYVQTSKGVYPYSTLQKAELKPTAPSQQLQKEEYRWMMQNDLVAPPYPFSAFLQLYESNSIYWACVNQIAKDVAGLGWALHLKDGQKESPEEHKRLSAFLNNPSTEDSLRKIFEQMLVDWGSIGNFGLEVARGTDGKIVNIFYVPGFTIRVHKSKEKFCQMRGTKKVWFKAFGFEKDIDSKTGVESVTAGANKANELIFYKNFYSRSDYYGVPNALAAMGDIIGLIGVRDYNLSFFENYGIPAAMIILEGDWEAGTDKKIKAFLDKEIKGSDNANKTMVVSQSEGCKFTYQKLSTEVKEGSFKMYTQQRREDILIAYNMPPERIGMRVTGSLGGNVAEEATKIYISGIVEPLQSDMEDLINKKLLTSEIYEFKFKDIDIRDANAISTRLCSEIQNGIRSPNEARNELGLKPYDGGDVFYMSGSLVQIGQPTAENITKSEKEFLSTQ